MVTKVAVSADSPSDPNCSNVSGGTSSITNSVIEDGGCGVIDNNNGNRTGDPDLQLLVNKGGLTQTHELLTASNALNTGGGLFCLATDQRGFARSDSLCDMGAYEHDAGPTAGVDQLAVKGQQSAQ